MADRLIAHVISADRLSDIDEVLHDAVFSMADVVYDVRAQVVCIPFAPARARDLSFRRRQARPSRSLPRNLAISSVARMTMEDPDGLIEHSYSRLLCLGKGHLTLRSNFPGQVDFDVTDVDIKVSENPDLAPR